MQNVPLGTKGSFSILVGPEHLASQFKDSILPPVFATPMMILAMENAALNAVRDFLDPGETAVGTKVDVSHLAPTPVGHTVRAEAEVIGMEGSHIHFTVAAWDDDEEIGRGTHERMVIDLSRLTKRLDHKAPGRPPEIGPATENPASAP
jgi:fluoroacetyl-CoA thioesterase